MLNYNRFDSVNNNIKFFKNIIIIFTCLYIILIFNQNYINNSNIKYEIYNYTKTINNNQYLLTNILIRKSILEVLGVNLYDYIDRLKVAYLNVVIY